MKVLIIEDEALAAERLENMLVELDPGIQVLEKLGSVKESVKWLMTNTPDLLFLDIQLSDGLSFSIFDQITLNTPVIFTTAYDQYAIKAFELNSVYYLLKPIRRDELAQSLNKYKSLKAATGFDFVSLLSSIGNKTPEYRKRFLIQIGDKFRKVDTDEIAYFYALDKNVFLKAFDGSFYPTELSLDSLEKVVDPSLFFRINRQYIINMNSISKMYAWSRSRIKVILKPEPDDNMETIVSIDRSSEFRKWMDK
jgi:DNA-binding LytR/AlgR family response regulator